MICFAELLNAFLQASAIKMMQMQKTTISLVPQAEA
jgi:hypothetical protein